MERLRYYDPSKEVRSNHRFRVFRGVLDEQPVFIKTPAAPEFAGKLQLEVPGMEKMRSLDPKQEFYAVPYLIEHGNGYIVTEWVDGSLMAEDFDTGDKAKVGHHLDYLTRLYVYIDSQEPTGVGVTRFNEPGQQTGVEKIMQNLEKVVFPRHIDESLVTETCQYIERVLPGTETRFTHGDLQPGNIIMSNGNPYVIDFESCSELWPRHYNVVNLIVNYSARYPVLRDDFQHMFSRYCQLLGVNPDDHADAFNISAAVRSLQLVYEWLSEQQREEVGGMGLSSYQRKYAEDIMSNVLSGRLFLA